MLFIVGDITDLAVSSNNALVASASNDYSIRVWHLPDGFPISVFRGHIGAVTAIAFSPRPSSMYQLLSCNYSSTASVDCSLARDCEEPGNFLEQSENKSCTSIFSSQGVHTNIFIHQCSTIQQPSIKERKNVVHSVTVNMLKQDSLNSNIGVIMQQMSMQVQLGMSSSISDRL